MKFIALFKYDDVFSVCMNVCILINTSACGEATCDER